MSAKVFDELYIYNFFPTEQGADIVKSREIAQQKMFLIHNALGEDSKIFDSDEEPTASGLFTKISTNSEDNEKSSISTIIRNDYNEIKESHPNIIERIEHLHNRVKTSKQHKTNNVVILRKKGMALFYIIHHYEDEKPVEKTFINLLSYVRCSFDEKRLSLDNDFWKSYEAIKVFKPTYKSNSSEKSLESKSLYSLKSLLSKKKKGIRSRACSIHRYTFDRYKKVQNIT